MARPRKLNRMQIGAALYQHMATGMLVKDACAELKVDPATIRKWSAEDSEFGTLYARAREEQAHALAEKAMEIAAGDDELTQRREQDIEDYATLNAAETNINQKVRALEAQLVNRDKMRVDTIKWLVSKIAPRLYGEKITQTIEGGEKPVEHTHRVIRWGDTEIPI